MSNELEQLEFKLEKNIGIEKHAGKFRKSNYSTREGYSHCSSIYLNMPIVIRILFSICCQYLIVQFSC